MLASWIILSLALLAPAHAEDKLPAECRDLPAYDNAIVKFGANRQHTKACREAVATIHATWNEMLAAKKRVPRSSAPVVGDSQASALHGAAAMSEGGAITKEAFAKIALNAQAKFKTVAKNLETRARAAVKDNQVILPKVINTPAGPEIASSAKEGLDNLLKLRASADSLGAEAGKLALGFQSDSTILAAQAQRTHETAERLDGGTVNKEEKKGVSKNTLFAVGGAAVIAAGVVGGLYWVSQSAIKSTDKAMELRIAQAETSANNVIKNAEESAKRIITFATNSANQIIANAEEAANRIYDRAKADVNALITDLRKEIQDTFENLTTKGLEKLKKELDDMFTKLIERAKKEGDKALEEKLKQTWDSIGGQINNEIIRRGNQDPTTTSGTSTSTSTSTGTGSGTSTSTGTSMSTATHVEVPGGRE